jgi:hypothetical protein
VAYKWTPGPLLRLEHRDPELQWDDARLHERQERREAMTRAIQSIGIRLWKNFRRTPRNFVSEGRADMAESKWPSFVHRRSSARRTGVAAFLGPLFLFSQQIQGNKGRTTPDNWLLRSQLGMLHTAACCQSNFIHRSGFSYPLR